MDGAEGGTHGGPATLQDDVGLPTMFALNRTVNYLKDKGVKDDISVIAAGALNSPGHSLKALALGADAVYIGSTALMAMLQTQMTKALPTEPQNQLVFYTGKLTEKLDIDEAAKHLSNYLKSCVEEMKLIA
jgi:glutamate synthase domain-containing protein 2